MELARETKPPSALHPRIRTIWRLSALLSGTITGVIFGGLSIPIAKVLNLQLFSLAPFAFLIAFLLFGGLTILFADRQYERWQYELRPYDLIIRSGLFWQTERSIARDRVQHIDINAGPMDRRFGLVQVVVYVAGGVGSVGLIPGLTPADAAWLKDQLLATRAQEA